jgi:hypothetical protein
MNFETVRTALIVGTAVQLYGFLGQKSRSIFQDCSEGFFAKESPDKFV